ncbi:MAG: FxsA family protein [Mycobacterium sp.]
MRPFLRYAGLYALVELAALALMVWAFGLGWTLIVLAVTFMVGIVLAASQVKGQVAAVRRARSNPKGAMTDGVLVGVGSFLVFMPGIVSTAAGALMLAPPTRGALRPLAAAMVTRGLVRRVDTLTGFVSGTTYVPSANYVSGPRSYGPRNRDYIDGEVIGEVVEQLPSR